MTFVIGLTGSIGMGKSTTARMFADAGVPVWDADAAVRRLYDVGGAATALIADFAPDAIENDAVSRAKLRDLIVGDPDLLDRVQEVVHPLVAQDRAMFLDKTDASIVVLDIPLLFEIGADADCDGVVVVTAPVEVQKQRVLERGEMSEADFDMIVARQMPDADKRRRARWVVETLTIDNARQSVAEILKEIAQERSDA